MRRVSGVPFHQLPLVVIPYKPTTYHQSQEDGVGTILFKYKPYSDLTSFTVFNAFLCVCSSTNLDHLSRF